MAGVRDALQKCNLCKDELVVIYPNENQYWFMDMEDELYQWMDEIEENIKRNGGYMIDEWQFVDAEQNLMDVRGCVHLKLADD